MKKLILVPALFVIACLFSGAYGAIHNQISYTVSPEYFTQFKFYQFQLLASGLPNRLNAAIVGWSAAWWMGIVIGMILIPAGLVIRGTKAYFTGMLKVFGLVTLTTLMSGISALLFAQVSVHADAVQEVTRYGNDIVNDVAFVKAGTMHNFSYLGGFLGLVTGGLAIAQQRRRQKRQQTRLRRRVC